MKNSRKFFYVKPDNFRYNIYNNKVLKSVVVSFVNSLDTLLINNSLKITVHLKVYDKPNLKPRYYKEIKVHQCILDNNINSIVKFYLDLERKLHSYPNLKAKWNDIDYLAFDYKINE